MVLNRPRSDNFPIMPPLKPARQGIQSVETGVCLLQALAGGSRAMSLKDLSLAAGMPAAKAHRYLVSLCRMGLVEQDVATSHYDLGTAALQLGLAALSRLDPMRIALPALERLRKQIDQTVALSVWGTHGATVVRWLESSHPVTAGLRTGTVMPLIRSATGRTFAAYLPPAAIRGLLDLEFRQFPPGQRAAQRKRHEQILAAVRKRGLANVAGDLIPGINAVAAPVFDAGGRVVLVITAFGYADTFDAGWEGKIAHAVKAATTALSEQLGHGHYHGSDRLAGRLAHRVSART
jgi:DNA-binding IclR family transcriptional regulator